MRHIQRVVAAFALTVSLGAAGQDDPIEAARTVLAQLPHSPHNSEVALDRLPSGAARVWINPNEDDMRLYSPAGAQMDADIQVSSVVSPAAPVVVSLVFESRGSLVPGPGPSPLALTVDGRRFAAAAVPGVPSRSGALLFLSARLDLSFDRFVSLAAARRVEGRIWDVPFVLLDAQLELLREYALRVAEAAR